MRHLSLLSLVLGPLAAMACASASGSSPTPTPTGGVAGVSAFFPPRDATGVCLDAPLRLTFSAPPTLGTSGRIQVFSTASPATPVDTIDLAVAAPRITIAGREFFYKPVIVDGNEAYVYLRRVLQAGQTYSVTIDAGVFKDAGGQNVAAISEATTWRFSTRAATAVTGRSELAVAADGSGDFCTVQGAIDAVPAGNTSAVTINVRPGTYREIVLVSSKHALRLRGADRKQTVIAYPNNDRLQTDPASGVGLGTRWRPMVDVEGSNDFTLENMTLHNTTPQGGSQAEALRVEGGLRTILRDADFKSLQDTLLLSGLIYVANSYVEGNVDFIWGKGIVYFDRCEIKTVGRVGYTLQARNNADTFGYVFVDSRMTADAGLAGHYIARTNRDDAAPAPHIALINCQLGSHIGSDGWLVDGTPSDRSQIRFWEYQSTTESGAATDVRYRIPESRQLTAAEAAEMRDVSRVLSGWNPK